MIQNKIFILRTHFSISALYKLKNPLLFSPHNFSMHLWICIWLQIANFTIIKLHKDEKSKYFKTPLVGSRTWSIFSIFNIRMITGVKTGVIFIQTWKNQYLKKLHRFLHRFSWFSFFFVRILHSRLPPIVVSSNYHFSSL